MMFTLITNPINQAWAISFTQYTGGTFTCTTYSPSRSQFAVFFLSGGFLTGRILSVNTTGFITSTITLGNISSASALDSSKNCAFWNGNDVYVTARPTNQNSIISRIDANTGIVLNQIQLTGTDSGCIAENVVVFEGAVYVIGFGSGANDCDVSGVGTSNNVVYQFTLSLGGRTDTNTGLSMASSCNDLYITYLGITARCGNLLLYNNGGTWTTFASAATTWTDCDGTSTTAIYCIRSNTVYTITPAGNSIFIAAANWRAIVRSTASGAFWLTDNTATLKNYNSAGVLAGSAVAPELVDVKQFVVSQNIVTGLGAGSGDPTILILNDNGELASDDTEPPTNGNQVDGVCQNGTALQCVGDRSTINQITGGQQITEVVNDLGNGLGIFNSTNTDIKTNGTGLLLMIMTGTFFASALLGTVHQLNQKGWISASIRDVDPIFWLFLVIGTVSFAFYLQWIPDIVFYGMVVGLAGLFAFGIYRHISSRSG